MKEKVKKTEKKPEMLNAIDASFQLGKGMSAEALNIWNIALSRAANGQFNKLHPLPHYYDYLTNSEHCATALEFDELEAISDPHKVEQFDALVDEYNVNLPRIIAEKDYAAVLTYYKKIHYLVTGQEFVDASFEVQDHNS